MIKKWILASLTALSMLITGWSYAADTLINDNEGNTITLTRNTCTNKTIKTYIPLLLEQFKGKEWFAGTVLFRERLIALCYTVIPFQGELSVVIIDEDGSGVVMPLKLFKGLGFNKKNSI